jgi:hypothetical protein
LAPPFKGNFMSEVVRTVLNSAVPPAPHAVRKGLVDNSLEIGAPTVLGQGLYMRHLPSGRVYPYEQQGAKRDDVEIFKHTADGKDVKINKPAKAKAKGPFAQRERAVGAYDEPADRVLTTTDNLASPE